MSDIRLAIIGAGIIAEAHLNAARDSEHVSIVAIVDPAQPRAKALAEQYHAACYASLGQLLEDDRARGSIDAVLICTPPSIRLELVESALAAGLPVMVEKPLAHQPHDAQALVHLAARHADLPTAVGYCHRFTPGIRKIKQMIQAGELGDLIRFENVFACWHPKMQTHWMSDPAVSGGGSLLDTGCHSVDIFHYLIGPSQIDAAVLRHLWPGRGDSNATLLIHHEPTAAGGAPVAGIIASGWAEPARFVVSVVGSKGLLTYDFEKPEQLLWARSTEPAQILTVQTHETRFRHQLEAFARLVQGDSSSRELATFEDGLAVALTLRDAMEQLVSF